MLKPGDLFAGTRIVRLLGEGEQASIYEGITPEGARRAIKLLAPDADTASRAAARLAQEGEALVTIHQINVLRCYRVGIERGRVFLLLELVEGETLRDKLARTRGGLPVDDLLRWAIQACEGVAAAHDAGIVHRDLKPENILVTPSDVVKVIDFGLAKLEHLGIQTTAGRFIGTALYAAPEQLRNGPVHPSWDVFAMGIILYEALAGAHPVDASSGNPMDICARHLDFRPRPLAKVAPRVPGDLAYLVGEALDTNPSRRPTMRALAERLRERLQRLSAPQLAEVRNLLPDRRVEAARTEPLPVMPAGTPPPRPVWTPPGALAATIPLPAFGEPPASGDRPALPPPPSSGLAARVLDARMPVPSTAVPPSARLAGPAGAERPSAGGHDASAPPVTAVAPAPGGARGRAVAVGIVALLAASAAGVWVWSARVPGDVGPRVTVAAGVAPEPAPKASSSAPAAPFASASAPPGSGAAPPRRGRGRGRDPRR